MIRLNVWIWKVNHDHFLMPSSTINSLQDVMGNFSFTFCYEPEGPVMVNKRASDYLSKEGSYFNRGNKLNLI